LQALGQSLKEELDQLKISSESVIRMKEDEFDQLRKEMKRETENTQLRIQNIEGSSAQSMRRLKEVESEHEKEKALLD
jgi:hypothetical protein